MKKIILLAMCAAAWSADALPTYEPFTEYAAAVAASGTNSIDLATGGYSVTNGATVEQWGGLLYSGTAGTGVHGFDIQVTNNSATVFTTANMATLLPAGFPGSSSAIQLCLLDHTNTANVNTVGNSAVLEFAQDITRPASGVKTIFASYLMDITTIGAAGGGNNGRYACFLPSTNLVEPSTVYPNWASLFNTFATAGGPTYISYGLKTISGGDYVGPSDSSGPNNGSVSTLHTPYNTAAFVVSEVVFTAGGSVPDTNIVWLNPATSSFGGATPASGSTAYTVQITMSDLGGFCIINRVGSGASGGMGSTYIGNLILGSTWSYVTGGPEFTQQPSNATNSIGGNGTVTLSAAAVAAGQTVSYQWQKGGVNVSNGAGMAGGNAVVSGSATTNLTLSGISSGDLGNYALLATASGTGFSLTSTTVLVTNDPVIAVPPQNNSTAPGASVTFSVTATTAFAPLTYQWQMNGVNLTEGTQGDSSVIAGATTSVLTISNYQTGDENNAVITCGVTNAVPEGQISSSAILTTADPAITTQPQNTTVNYGATATFTAVAQTAHAPLTYAWYKGATMLTDGAQAGGSMVTGSSGSSGNPATPSLTIANATYLDDGTYTFYVTNSLSAVTSSAPAVLTVNDPYIISQPTSANLPLNGTAHLNVSAAGTATLTYQWYNGALALSNGGDISGSSTAALTVSPAQFADDGSYTLVVTGGSGASATSAVATVTAYTTAGITGISPGTRTDYAGDHVGFVTYGNFGTGPYYYQWSLNGTPISGATASSLNVANITSTNAGTYTVTIGNAIGTNDSGFSSTLVVSNNYIPLASTNLIVARVGDGIQSLNINTGNTLYLDQFETNGTYVSSTMIPDAPTTAYGTSQTIAGVPTGQNIMLVPFGGGTVGIYESVLNLSTNNEYLNFCGFNFTLPYVTTLSLNTVRAIGAMNGYGYYNLCITNYNLYAAGNQEFRSVVSTDGLTNFWATGLAGSGQGIKFDQTGAGYNNTGTGIPSVSGSTNTRVVEIIGGNVVFSDAKNTGLCAVLGLPISPAASNEVINTSGSPNDFAASPDTNTVYIADDEVNGSGGGIQRWDWNGAAYQETYVLLDTTASGTNGTRGLTVDFSANANWGSSAMGAILYATTSEASSNRLIRIVDNGSGSPAAILATAGPNQILRGVRFGPVIVPLSIAAQPQSQSSVVTSSTNFSIIPAGTGPYGYQWYVSTNAATTNLIAGANTSTLSITNIQLTNAGSYFVVLSNFNNVSVTSAVATLDVFTGPPTIAGFSPSNRVETVGDHLVFVVAAAGETPFSYQWTFNGANISGATSSVLSLTNIQTTNSGTYSVAVSNPVGPALNPPTGILVVTTTLQPLSSTNLVVSRVGDGAQTLNATNGDTLYLDQFETNGTYVNTIMIPDAVPAGVTSPGPALTFMGSGDGTNQNMLTLSGNNEFINFAGYNFPLSATNVINTTGYPRGLGAVNAFGYYSLAYTNSGLYSGGGLDIRSAYSSDGLFEFWTTGSASSPGVKYVQTGNTSYVHGGGVPAIVGTSTGTRMSGVAPASGNFIYTDISSPGGPSLLECAGLPTAANSASNQFIVLPAGASPDDFAYSPNDFTVYLANEANFTTNSAEAGGIERWDWNGSAFQFAYTLATGSTAGARGVTVDFRASPSWGPGVLGAVIYATTSEKTGNRLIRIVDTGAGSTPAVLATAGPNQLINGVRFGPVPGLPAIVTQPQPQTTAVGGSAVFSVAAVNGPLSYQWQLNNANLTNGPSISGSGATISGATSANLTVANVTLNDGQNETYSVIVNNPYGPATSSGAGLTVVITPPQFSSTNAIVFLGGGNIQVNYSGVSGTVYSLWTSPDVTLAPIASTWTLLTNGTFSSGLNSFVDTGGTNSPRFYVITQSSNGQ